MPVLKRTFTVTPGVTQNIEHDLDTEDVVVQGRFPDGTVISLDIVVNNPHYISAQVDKNYPESYPQELELYIAY